MTTESLSFLLLLSSTSIAVLLLLTSWQRRALPNMPIFVGLIAAVAIWNFFYSLELASILPAHALWWGKSKYIGVLLVPAFWFVFAYQYNGRRLTLNQLILIFLPQLVLLVLVVIVPVSRPVWRMDRIFTPVFIQDMPPGYAFAFMLGAVYYYSLILIGVFLLWRVSVQSLEVYKRQVRWLLAGYFIPVLANGLVVMGLSPLPAVDTAPLAFTLGLAIAAWGLWHNSSDEIATVAYASVIDSLPDAVIVLDLQGRVLAANQRLLGFLRQPAAAIVGKPAEDIFPEVDKSFVRQHAFMMAGSVPLTINQRHYEMIVTPLLIHGDVQGRVVVFRDVTVQLQSQAALFTYERRYRALFENSHEAIFIIDLDQTIISANERAAELLGVALDELLQDNALLYFRENDSFIEGNRLGCLLKGETIPPFEQVLVSAANKLVPTEVNLTLVRDNQGAPLHIQAIVRDITERKLVEQALNRRIEELNVLRQVDDEINTLKIQRVYQIGLDAAYRLAKADAGFIAITEGEMLYVKYVMGMYPPDWVGGRIGYGDGVAGRVLADQEPLLIKDVRQDPDYHRDIPPLVSMMVLPLILQERLVGMMVLETKDATCFTAELFAFMQILANRIAVALENARLYEYVSRELNEKSRLYDKVSRLEHLKTDMIRVASHDLKAPLNIFAGYLEMLMLDSDQFDPLYHEFFAAMKKAVLRMTGIIQDILSLERIEQRAEGGYSPFDLSQVVALVVDDHQAQALRQQQNLQFELSVNNVTVYGDEPQLNEAIRNLVGNALKYTPAGGTIWVRLTQQGNQTHFTVQDTGYGIPEDRQARLFEPFYRAKTPGTEEIEGTGLGLYLVRNVIERHAGTMQFQSVIGQGSTFGFTLPVFDQQVLARRTDQWVRVLPIVEAHS